MGKVNIYYDKEGDFLEIIFNEKDGHFIGTDNYDVMEKIDEDGKIIGLSIMNVSLLKNKDDLNLYLRTG